MPFSPYSAVTTTTGTMATPRVSRRRAHCGMRRRRKPSITIWPASVAVTVELSPEASSATANRIEAMLKPSSGESSAKAWLISATSWCPVPWKATAATIRIEALTNSARISAMVESVVAHLMASRLPASVRS